MSVLFVESGLPSHDSDRRGRLTAWRWTLAAMVELQNAAMEGKVVPGTRHRVSCAAGSRALCLSIDYFVFVEIVGSAPACTCVRVVRKSGI